VRAPRGDSAVMVVVLVVTVTVDLIWAVAAGTVLASLIAVKRFGDLEAVSHSSLAALLGQGGWAPVALPPEGVLRSVHVLHLRGPLFFGNASGLQDLLGRVRDARAVVLTLDGMHYLDQSGAYALEDLVSALAADGRFVLLGGVSDALRRVLERLEVIPQHVTGDRVFGDQDEAFAAATRLVQEGVLAAR
jgi:sulfate permease, SulP family